MGGKGTVTSWTVGAHTSTQRGGPACRQTRTASGASNLERRLRDLKLIFGYAICGDCRDRLAKKISIKTLQNIDELKNSYTKLNDYTRIQLEYALNKEELPPIKNCTFTGTPIHQMKEYQVSAVIFRENQASEAIVYGEVFIKDFEQCLSEDTKDELDDFFNRIVDLPPSLKDLFDERVLVI